MAINKVKKVDERGEPKWTLLTESSNPSIDLLFDIYRQDSAKAKVIYCQNKGGYEQTRKVLFEYSNGDFSITTFVKKFGISVTNRIYSSSRVTGSIIYKGNKFYNSGKNKFVQLTYNGLLNQLNMQFVQGAAHADNIGFQYMLKRFGWLRNLIEIPEGHHLSFNTVVGKKLFNRKAMFRHLFGCPYGVAEIILSRYKDYHVGDALKIWSQTKKVLINIDNLKVEFLASQYFKDACLMADSLGRKVNCSWGLKRLKSEHDQWAKEVTEIVLEFEPLLRLNVGGVFLDFANFSGLDIITTNHELIREGKSQNHCVGTYSNAVNSGRSGIYRVDGYTMELNFSSVYMEQDKILASSLKSSKLLKIAQIKGYRNSSPPKDLTDRMTMLVNSFNLNGEISKYEDVLKDMGLGIFDRWAAPNADLPF